MFRRQSRQEAAQIYQEHLADLARRREEDRARDRRNAEEARENRRRFPTERSAETYFPDAPGGTG